MAYDMRTMAVEMFPVYFVEYVSGRKEHKVHSIACITVAFNSETSPRIFSAVNIQMSEITHS